MAVGLGVVAMSAAEPASAETRGSYRLLSLGGHPVKWETSAPLGRVVLSYAVADRDVAQPEAVNCRRMRAPASLLHTSRISESAFRSALAEAFQRWRDVADIAFVAVETGRQPDIVIGEQGEPGGFAFTNVALAEGPGAGARSIVGASICLNPERRWKVGYDGDLAVYDLVHTLTHEIGHAIGLDHPGARGQLMSFRYSEDHVGLTEGDKLGAIAIYGASRIRSAVTAGKTEGDGEAKAVTTTIGRGLDSGSGLGQGG